MFKYAIYVFKLSSWTCIQSNIVVSMSWHTARVPTAYTHSTYVRTIFKLVWLQPLIPFLIQHPLECFLVCFDPLDLVLGTHLGVAIKISKAHTRGKSQWKQLIKTRFVGAALENYCTLTMCAATTLSVVLTQFLGLWAPLHSTQNHHLNTECSHLQVYLYSRAPCFFKLHVHEQAIRLHVHVYIQIPLSWRSNEGRNVLSMSPYAEQSL